MYTLYSNSTYVVETLHQHLCEDTNFVKGSEVRNNPFETIRGSNRDIVKSYQWYQNQIKNLGLSRMRPSALMQSEIGELTNRLQVGSLYLFQYNPKLKDELPVYDRFPLVLPFRSLPDGFLGLNLHYLPYVWRARMLGQLYKLATTTDRTHPNTRIRLSWNLINNSVRYPGVEMCVKRYLTKHLRSMFLKIHPVDWKAAIFLPVEDFRKMSKEQVFTRTRKNG